MAALVAALLASTGGKPAWRAAMLADRFRDPAPIIAAAALALAAASGLAALAGMAIGRRLTPEAAQLLLALALLLQGGGMLGPVKPPGRLDRSRTGSFPAEPLGLFVLATGDGIQFVVLALAARTPLPWLAAAGGAAGTLAVVASAALLGERGWLALPLRPVRWAVALLFLLTGAVLAFDALALI